jgi:hypothetical protein
MPSLKEIVAIYKNMLEAGANMEVIEKFYADDIIQAENEDTIIKGKVRVLELEKNNLAGVDSSESKIDTLIIDEEMGLVMGEMSIRFISKKMGKKRLKEAFVQQWADGKIKYQKFYYKDFTDGE